MAGEGKHGESKEGRHEREGERARKRGQGGKEKLRFVAHLLYVVKVPQMS